MTNNTIEKESIIPALNGRFINQVPGQEIRDCINVPTNSPANPIAITNPVVPGADNESSAGSSTKNLIAIPKSRNFPIKIAFRQPKAERNPPPAKTESVPNKIAIAKRTATLTEVPATNCAIKYNAVMDNVRTSCARQIGAALDTALADRTVILISHGQGWDGGGCRSIRLDHGRLTPACAAGPAGPTEAAVLQ